MKIPEKIVYVITGMLVFALLFASCGNPFMDESKTAKNGTTSVIIGIHQENAVEVQGNISVDARTIEIAALPEITRYRLFGSKNGESQMMLGEFGTIGPASKVNLENGSWQFTLRAYGTGNNILLQAQLDDIILSGNPQLLEFTLEILDAGTGEVEVHISWPEDIDVAQVQIQLANNSTEISEVTENSYIYQNSLERGNYLIIFSLFDSQGNETASIPELLRIYPNMKSSATFVLEKGDFNSSPAAPDALLVVSNEDLLNTEMAAISLTWKDNSVNESGFELQFSDDSGLTWVDLDTEILPASEQYDHVLLRGSSRSYRIRAVNSFGGSDWAESEPFTAPWLVRFEVNGGSSILPQEVWNEGTVQVPGETVKYGSIFGGWYGDEDLTVDWDFDTSISSNIILYAQWTMALLLDPNRGQGELVELLWSDGQSENLPENIFTRDGYDFVGWSLEPLGAVDYADQAEYTMEEGDTLYARWNRSDAAAASAFSYIINDRTINITGYLENSNGTVIVPDMIEGYPVRVISGTTAASNRGAFNNKNLTGIVFPETLDRIEHAAFYRCRELTELVFPEGMTSIGDNTSGAFYQCTSLLSVTFPSTLVSIGSYAFSNCTALENVVFSESLVSIGMHAFQSCSALREITLPESLEIIGNSAFHSSGLEYLYIPAGVTQLGNNSFAFNNNLVEIEIAASMETTGTTVFQYCANLESVRFTGVVGHLWGTTISSTPVGMFSNCTSLHTVELPEGMHTLGRGTFRGCTSLEEVYLPDSVTFIGISAFENCSSLRRVHGGNIITIESSAFRNAGQLESFIFPHTLANLNAYAFSGCSSLSSIEFTGTSLETIGLYAFSGCSSLSEVILPSGLRTVQNHAFDGCTILSRVELPEGLETIGNYAFRNNTMLQEITFPDSVSSLGTGAFQNNRSLRTVHIGNGLTSVPNLAFTDCIRLNSVTLGENIQTIGNDAFMNTAIQEISFPDGIQSIGNRAFSNAGGPRNIVFPDSLTSIGTSSFESCSQVEEITFGAGLLTIPESAFANNDSLQTVDFRNIETIGVNAFVNSESLVEIYLPKIKVISSQAFMGALQLEKVHIGEEVTRIEVLAFAVNPHLSEVYIDALNPPLLVSANAFSTNASGRQFLVRDFYLNDEIPELYRNSGNWKSFAAQIVKQ